MRCRAKWSRTVHKSRGQGNARFTWIDSNRAFLVWSLDTENILDDLTFEISNQKQIKICYWSIPSGWLVIRIRFISMISVPSTSLECTDLCKASTASSNHNGPQDEPLKLQTRLLSSKNKNIHESDKFKLLEECLWNLALFDIYETIVTGTQSGFIHQINDWNIFSGETDTLKPEFCHSPEISIYIVA